MGKSTTNSINDHFQYPCTRLDQEHPSRFQLGDLLSKGLRHLDTVGHWDEGWSINLWNPIKIVENMGYLWYHGIYWDILRISWTLCSFGLGEHPTSVSKTFVAWGCGHGRVCRRHPRASDVYSTKQLWLSQELHILSSIIGVSIILDTPIMDNGWIDQSEMILQSSKMIDNHG